jgi:hypothetical protein
MPNPPSKSYAATQKQVAVLINFGIDFPENVTKEQASKLISEAIARGREGQIATAAQKSSLRRLNVEFDNSTTAAQAWEMIARAIEGKRAEMITLEDVRAYDPNGGRGLKAEKRFACPFCKKKATAENRDLAVNEMTGRYFCHACQARGILREYAESSRPAAPFKPVTVAERIKAASSAPAAFDSIERKWVEMTMQSYEGNQFVKFLIAEFGYEETLRAVKRYCVGTSKMQTIFWQIDELGNVRTGKAISYDAETGKRIKKYHAGWIHDRSNASLERFSSAPRLRRNQSRS